MSGSVFPVKPVVTRRDRERRNQHRATVIWLTGRSGSGKTSIANALDKDLFENRGVNSFVIDADNMRSGLNAGLGFTEEDRMENIRRIAYVAKTFVDAGVVCIVACIAPMEVFRERSKDIIGTSDYFEIFVKCSVEECKNRDPKGLYNEDIDGSMDFKYEPPTLPALTIDTEYSMPEDAVKRIVQLLADTGVLSPPLNYGELPDAHV